MLLALGPDWKRPHSKFNLLLMGKAQGPWALGLWTQGPWALGSWALDPWALGPWSQGPCGLGPWALFPCLAVVEMRCVIGAYMVLLQ